MYKYVYLDIHQMSSSMNQKCVKCGSADVHKFGIRYGREKKQRWQCKACGHIFSKPLDARNSFSEKGGNIDKK